MRKCPKCGRAENEIEMTTMVEPAENNAARCPCGWTGRTGELAEEKKAPAKAEEKKADKTA